MKVTYGFGKPHRLKSDERKEEGKRGMQYERKSLKSRKEERLSHRTGQGQEPEDISWPSSPIGTVSCTAFVLCHRTGRPEEPEDISWPSSPIGVASCTAFVLCHRTDRPAGGAGGHQLAVVAYRGGQLYCICTMS